VNVGEEYVIALDVGGTSVKSGVVARGGRIVGAPDVTPIESNAAAEVVLDALAAIVQKRLDTLPRSSVLGIGLGFPGPFDYEHGICLIAEQPKFRHLYGVNVKAALAARLGMDASEIRFRNDAEAAIVGEARYGAGQAYRRLIGVTLGTGLGAAFLEDGAAVRTGRGVPEGGELYPEWFRGRWADDWFSIRGLVARARAAGAVSDDPQGLADAARSGDAALRRVFDEFGKDLGAFLTPFVVGFGAEAVIVLGGLAGAFDLFGAGLAAQMPVPVKLGELGASAALLGAGELFG